MGERSKSLLGRNQRDQFARGLVYVLLFLITYGSSVGVAHRHDGLSILEPAAASASSDSQASVDNSDTSTQGPVKPHECEICQFRQSLSNGAIYTARVVQAQTETTAAFLSVTPPISSTTLTIGQGRAPPFIS
jgi:hypothetical protein